jgi:hypothetical protein
MHIHPSEGEERQSEHRGFLLGFAACGFGRAGISGFDMAAGKQPAVQAAVVDEQDVATVRVNEESRASEVTGGELVAGQGIGRMRQEPEDEFTALLILRLLEFTNQVEGLLQKGHLPKLALLGA